MIGGPGWEALPYLLGTGLVHIAYAEALVAAYQHGDFSTAYPIARGGGALLAALGAVVFLDDHLPPAAWFAIGIAATGLFLRRTGAPGGRRAWRRRPPSCIATYTLIDSAGLACRRQRRVLRPGRLRRRRPRRHGGQPAPPEAPGPPAPAARRLASLPGRRPATLTAYTMVLVAVRLAPVGYVTMLRESSVVIGPLLGWLVLHEPLGRSRVAPAGVVLTGLVLLVLTA